MNVNRQCLITDQIVLTIPEDISDRARQIAETIYQPVEQNLIAHLQTLSAPLHALPLEEQAELDDALWTIAREQMPDDSQTRAHDLMARNVHGLLTDDEYAELEKLVERADRLMLRKAEAAALLRLPGYSFTAQDFKPLDG